MKKLPPESKRRSLANTPPPVWVFISIESLIHAMAWVWLKIISPGMSAIVGVCNRLPIMS